MASNDFNIVADSVKTTGTLLSSSDKVVDETITTMQDWFLSQGLSETMTGVLLRTASVMAAVILCYVTFFIARRIVVKTLTRLIRQSKVQWDDKFLENKVFTRLAHLAPAIVILLLSRAVFHGYDGLIILTQQLAKAYMIIVSLWAVSGLTTALIDVLRPVEQKHRVPIRTLLQALKLIIFFLGGMFILSLFTKSAWNILAGLGGLTAVLILVFKDTILGFVSGIQLSVNRMISRGDWIEMPQYGADGDVIDITLTTVKVQNFDKTISTIPTYALMSGSFKNWRGMSESEGRRIKRSINLDMNSVKFCTEAMIEKYSTFQCIREYIAEKKKDVAEHNAKLGVEESSLVNGRHLTNIGTFRAYVLAYLRNHPKIHKNMTFLVRQLAPTERGLPIEIYVFCIDQRWVQYEDIQADIFDHILAILPEFELRVFQNPTGADFGSLGGRD